MNKSIDLKPIPVAIVEKTWHEFAGLGPDQAEKEVMKVGNAQPDLLAFLMGKSEEMSREVSELAIYLFLVVYRMFLNAQGKIRKVSYEEITKCYEHHEALMERLNGAHNKFLDMIASNQSPRQPHIVKYVVDALLEEDEEGVVSLTDEQRGFLFLLLKAVIDVLDQKRIKG